MDFIDEYLTYVGVTETPQFYHRWCCLSMVGAYLGRQYHYKFGHSHLHPNLYVMLIGTPGARKSTAIKISKKLITLAGYSTISADRSSKEKFLLDLSGEGMESTNLMESMLEHNLWGEDQAAAREMYIACDEFNDFIGNGNIEFISLLGNLWDFEGNYENRIKSGKSVSISNPTISILGGNTPVNFARAFPPEILGQGFFSRLLLIHGESTGRRITFPVMPSANDTMVIVDYLMQIKGKSLGEAKLIGPAKALIDKIYTTWKGIDDYRFDSYANRRLTHLLKLCLVVSACRYRSEITEDDVVYANTILTHTEYLMPKALGEFGKSRNSDVTHKIMRILDETMAPMKVNDIWAYVSNDLDKVGELVELIRNLVTAEKIFHVDGGFLSKKKVVEQINSDVINYDLLTDEERKMVL